jgi:hypothetical protein
MWPNNNGRLAPRITLDAYAQALSVHYRHRDLAESRSEFVDQFVSEYIEFLVSFAVRRTGKPVIVDKITPYAGTWPLVQSQIKKYLPESRLIHLVRDGRDVATSGAFDWLLKDAAGTPRYQFFIENTIGMTLTRFFDDELIRKWAGIWNESVRSYSPQTYRGKIRYEAMLADQAQVLRQVFEWLEVDTNDAVVQRCVERSSFERTSGRPPGAMDATNKQRIGVSGNWREYFTRRDAELFDRVAGEALVAECYETDNRWVRDRADDLNMCVPG